MLIFFQKGKKIKKRSYKIPRRPCILMNTRIVVQKLTKVLIAAFGVAFLILILKLRFDDLFVIKTGVFLKKLYKWDI